MRAISIVLLLLSLALEALSWKVFVAEQWFPLPSQRVLTYLGVHFTASLFAAFGTRGLLEKVMRRSRIKEWTYMVSVAFFIPTLGTLGLLLSVLPTLRWPKVPRVEAPWGPTEMPELPDRPFRVSAQAIYVAVGLVGVIRHSVASDQRLRAVMATRQLPDREAIPILNVALKDPADDVRLLAYSMLDGKERQIYSKINAELEKLKDPDVKRPGRLQRRLAQQYWELAYLGLAQGDVLTLALSEALSNIEKSLTTAPRDPGAHMLRARILLRKDQVEDAEKAFKRARSFGLPREVISPYLAEISFRLRRFDKLKENLEAMDDFSRNRFPLSRVAEFWLEDRDMRDIELLA